jgi:hypothetical protein
MEFEAHAQTNPECRSTVRSRSCTRMSDFEPQQASFDLLQAFIRHGIQCQSPQRQRNHHHRLYPHIL